VRIAEALEGFVKGFDVLAEESYRTLRTLPFCHPRLHDFQPAPPLLLVQVRRTRIFVYLKPETEPVDGAAFGERARTAD